MQNCHVCVPRQHCPMLRASKEFHFHLKPRREFRQLRKNNVMSTVCEVPGIFEATALRPSLFLHPQRSQDLAAALFCARAPQSTRRSGFLTHCLLCERRDEEASPLGTHFLTSYFQTTSTAAATSFSPSTLPQHSVN